MKTLRQNVFVIALFCLLGLMAPTAFAAAPDYTTVTAAVDFGSVVTGLLAIGALIAAIMAARKGLRILLSFIK